MGQEEPINLDDNTAADWEGADEIEQDLQNKIRSDMREQNEPKIEDKQELLEQSERLLEFLKEFGKLTEEAQDNEMQEYERTIEDLRKLIKKLAE